MLVHAQVGKHLPTFRHHGQPHARNAVAAVSGDFCAFKTNTAGLGAFDAEQAADQGGFAHAIAPEQAHDLTGTDFKVNAKQHLAGTIGSAQTLGLQ